uniref:Uncharacterized protein n=1 Tax=Magallana gigas TaxID=29159 RepID=A0A8W8K103_MAGGI
MVAANVIASVLSTAESQRGEYQGLKERSGVEAREFRNIANNLLLRLMVVVEDTVKELGITKEELREVQRKRSYITACYFQAVTCY